jgi:hypothetical protein
MTAATPQNFCFDMFVLTFVFLWQQRSHRCEQFELFILMITNLIINFQILLFIFQEIFFRCNKIYFINTKFGNKRFIQYSHPLAERWR